MPRTAQAFLVMTALGWPTLRAGAQPCQPYYADMGPTPHTFSESYFAVFDDGSGPALYRGDYLDRALIRWTGREWLNVPMTGTVTGFSPIEPKVFTDAVGTRLYIIGRTGSTWSMYVREGTQWAETGICIGACGPYWTATPFVSIDFGSGPELFGLGRISLDANTYVMRWQNGQWNSIGATLNYGVTAVVAYDDGSGPALYILGEFTVFQGIQAPGAAKWNGKVWTSGTPPQTRVFGSNNAVVADLGDGPAIYTTSKVYFNGQDHVGVNKWNGEQWTFIGAPNQLPPPATPRYINTLGAFDDGRGTALYIAGVFSSFQGVPARSIVRWNGAIFEPLGTGIVGEVEDVNAFLDQRGPALHISGGSSVVGAGGGTLQQHGVLWIGCPNCYANCDLTTIAPRLNVSDFICFLNKFAARDPYANCSGDAAIDITDFSCFMNTFAAGCP